MVRENQGLQIALILFVMISVVLAVTTYVYWKKGDDLARVKLAAEDARTAMEGDLAAARREIGELKGLMGYAPEAKRGEIDANYKAEMALFEETYQGDRNYRTLPVFLVDELVKRSSQLSDAHTRQTGLETQVSLVREQEGRLKGQALDAQQKTLGDMARLREIFTADRTKIVTDQTALAAQLEREAQARARAQEAAKIQIDKLAGDLHKRDLQVATLLKKIADLQGETSADGADGKIMFVDQGSRIVQINAGDADGLRRQMSFTVIDRDATARKGVKAKATIEVTKILEPHLAEARIVTDEIRDPILTGDQFFSPLWARGQKLRFALAGFLDIDGDGKSDRGRVKAIITASGGEVSAEVTDEGQRTGKIDIDTRYLVVGQAPTDKTQPQQIEAFSTITSEAGRLGIEQLSLPRLLGFLERESRTTHYGR